MQRLSQLNNWLTTVLKEPDFTLAPASADASFRRYFRVTLGNNNTFIAMDAPPPQENCAPFVHVAEEYAKAGINVPKLLATNIEQGFLLLTDLGDTTYLSALNANQNDPKYADHLYRDAWNALIKMQLASQQGVFPEYDEALLTREMQLFPDWYITKHLQVTLDDAQKNTLHDIFALLNQNILAQGQVYVHRDYHSRNLMLQRESGQNPGILDFQDAVHGAITYDLVSLLKDAYIAWEEEQVLDWTVRYWQAAKKQNCRYRKIFPCSIVILNGWAHSVISRY